MKYLSKPLRPAVSAVMRCDFCGVPNPAIVYAANRMTIGLPIRCWRWAACSECAALVEAENFAEIIRRVVEVLRGQHPPEWGDFDTQVARRAADFALSHFHEDAVRE